jgi:uncharacterized membrane protein
MDLAPLLNASPIIQIHAYAAFAAIALGAFQLFLRKGDYRHRHFGYAWVGLMTLIAFSSFFIHSIRMWGPFSPIHILSANVLIGLPFYAWQAHNGKMQAHGRKMVSTFILALIVTGFFTFWPGRIMHAVLFGS